MRARGMGSVFRKKGSLNWHVAYQVAGKRREMSSGSPDRRVAINLLKQLNGEVAQGRPIADGKLTLKGLLDLVEADYVLNARKSTPPLARLREYFGENVRVLDLGHAVLMRYATDRLKQGAARATVRNELAALGRGFTLAHRSGRLPYRPSVPTIRVENARQGFFTDADVEALLPHLPEYLRPLVEVAYLTGWRRGELVNLRWRNVDWKAGELRLAPGTTKNGDARVFPFAAHPRLARLLHELRERVSAIEAARDFSIPWVFVHADGRQVRGWWYDEWPKACEAAGIGDRHFHDLRRSAATNFAAAGVPVEVSMELMGHKTRAMHDRYHITSSTAREEAVARLAQHGGQHMAAVLPMRKRA